MAPFLVDKEVNFVYIATPNLLHYEQIKKALLAEENVVCEKPFCTKAEQAHELVDIAKERHLFLVETVMMPFMNGWA